MNIFLQQSKGKKSLTSWSDSTYFDAMIRSKVFKVIQQLEQCNHELFTYKYGTHIPHFVISRHSAMLSVNTAFTQPISKR